MMLNRLAAAAAVRPSNDQIWTGAPHKTSYQSVYINCPGISLFSILASRSKEKILSGHQTIFDTDFHRRES